MQQSSATPKNKDIGRGLRKIVACSQPYLAVLSCIYSFGTVTSLHLTSFLCTCFTHFSHGKGHPGLNCMHMHMWYVQRKLSCDVHIRRTYVRTYAGMEGRITHDHYAQTQTSGNVGIEVSVSLPASLFVIGTSMISYRADWYVNHSLQSNSGEEQEEKGYRFGMTDFRV